ncbi:MAG: hypothetical protein PSV35_04540 [bacterium]|nr:hypothetical protein [bacterium]
MSALNIPATHIYLSSEKNYKEKFLAQPDLLEHLKGADQMIRISSDYFIFSENSPLQTYINPKAIHKFLGEHERYSTYGDGPLCRSLGFGTFCYGIKISPMEKITFVQAFDIFKKEDPQFASDLLLKTMSSSAKTFSETHQLAPAYFNNFLPFYRLLLLLSINKTISKGKNIVLYSSGSALSAIFQQSRLFDDLFLKDSSIKEVRVVHRDSKEKSKQFPVNPQGQQIIYVFHGYKISDDSYNALYQQAEIGGVSGDNSLEMAISAQLLPYYRSTNGDNKKETLITLSNIIEKKIVLPEATKKDLLVFFRNVDDWSAIIDRYNDQKARLATIAAQFATINFPEMLKAWPLVVEHLDKHYNFNRQLPAIINDKPLLANIEVFEATPDVEIALSKVSQAQMSFFAGDASMPDSPVVSKKMDGPSS